MVVPARDISIPPSPPQNPFSFGTTPLNYQGSLPLRREVMGIEISLAGSLFVCLSDVCRVHPVSGWHMQPAGWMAHIGWSGPAQLAWLKAAATRFHCRPGWGHIVAAARLQLVSSKFANKFLSDAANGQTEKAKTWWGNESHTKFQKLWAVCSTM